MSDFVGACPICSKKMRRVAGEKVECPEGHYAILEETFDEIWAGYPAIGDTKGFMASTALLLKLREANLLEKKDKK